MARDAALRLCHAQVCFHLLRPYLGARDKAPRPCSQVGAAWLCSFLTWRYQRPALDLSWYCRLPVYALAATQSLKRRAISPHTDQIVSISTQHNGRGAPTLATSFGQCCLGVSYSVSVVAQSIT